MSGNHAVIAGFPKSDVVFRSAELQLALLGEQSVDSSTALLSVADKGIQLIYEWRLSNLFESALGPNELPRTPWVMKMVLRKR